MNSKVNWSILLITVCYLSCAAQDSAAQTITNTKVWVFKQDNSRNVGIFYSADSISLTIIENSEPLRIEVGNIREVRTGNKNGWLGPVIGAAGGGLIGGTFAAANYEPCDCYFDLGREGEFVVGMIIGGGIGLAIGSAAGLSKQKFIINGDPEAFKKFLTVMKKKAAKR